MAKINDKNDVPENLPKHIAFIMDGNGRWAKKRLMPRKFGHVEGAKTFKKIVRYCKDIGIRYISFYAFSTENWKRPEDEGAMTGEHANQGGVTHDVVMQQRRHRMQSDQDVAQCRQRLMDIL